MKRVLSILLALMMIFSTVSFAAPSMAGVVDTAVEETQQVAAEQAEEADLSADDIYDDNYGLLLAKIDFEDLEEGSSVGSNTLVSNLGYATENLPFNADISLYRSGTSLVVQKDENGNNYGLFTKTAGKDQYCKIGFRPDSDTVPMPHGIYTMKANIKVLTMNGTEVTSDTTISDTWTTTSFLARDDGSFGGERNYMSKTTNSDNATISNGNWQISHTYKYLEGTTYHLNGWKADGSTPNLEQNFKGVSAILLMYNAGATNGYTYAMDNFELYYKAPYTVTFANGGVNAEFVGAEKAEAYTLPGGTVDVSAYSYDNTSEKLFKGWVDANGKYVTGTITPTEDITLTAAWEDAYDEDYGMLIAAVDFDKIPLGTTFEVNNTRYSVDTYGVVAPSLPDKFPEEIFISYSANGATVVGTETDKYVSLYSTKTNGTGKQSWPRISFITKDESGDHLFNAPGTYTMLWTLKQDTENSKNASISTEGNNMYFWTGTLYSESNKSFPSNPTSVISSGLKTGWNFTRGTYTVLDGETITSTKGTFTFQGIGAFQAMPTVTSVGEGVVTTTNEDGSTKTTYSFENYTLMDDLKLYYKAPVEMTFVDSEGYANNLPDTKPVGGGAAYTLPALTTDEENVSFIGWSYEENGDVITTSSITPNEDTTLYAKWATTEAHPVYGKVIFDLNFESATDFSNNAMYIHGYVNPDDENSNTWSMTSGGFTGSMAIYGENKDGVVVSKNGVKVETEGVTDYAVVNKFLGANGATGRNPQFVPTTGYNGKSNLITFADKGIFTIVSDLAYNLGENSINTISSTHDYQFRHYTHYWTDAEHTTSTWKHDSLLAFKDVTKRTLGENVWSKRMATSDGSASFDATTITVSGTTYDVKETSSLYRFLIYYTYKNAFPYTNATTGVTQANGSEDLFKLDNVILYWKPYTANLTIDMKGNTALTIDGLTDHDTTQIISIDSLYTEDMIGTVYDGQVFRGLSLTDGGEPITEDFYLTEDTTLYAIWKEGAIGTLPTIYTENSIRTDANHGIRFKASVTTAQREAAAEYGFIVTRASLIENNSLEATDLKFDSVIPYAVGKSYIAGTDTDYVFSMTAEEVFFTGVFVGVPAIKEYYEEEIVARAYVKYTDGTIAYGNPHARSILDVAMTLRDTDYADIDEAGKAKIQDILEICGVPNEKNAILTVNGDNGQLYGSVKADGISSKQNGKVQISIVDDPLNTGRDNVLFVDADLLDGGTNNPHNYIWFENIGYKPGATYKISYDVLGYGIDAVGNDISDETLFTGDHLSRVTGSGNCFYFDSEATKTNSDGTITTGINVNQTSGLGYTAYTDKWVTVSKEVTLSATLDPTKEHRFGIYVTPRKKNAIETASDAPQYARSIYLDNISIVEVTE